MVVTQLVGEEGALLVSRHHHCLPRRKLHHASRHIDYSD
jgi:hypothetical protein